MLSDRDLRSFVVLDLNSQLWQPILTTIQFIVEVLKIASAVPVLFIITHCLSDSHEPHSAARSCQLRIMI